MRLLLTRSRHFVRSSCHLLVWLLVMLAVPLQAYAAAAMVHCGSSGSAQPAALLATTVLQAHAQHALPDSPHSHHDLSFVTADETSQQSTPGFALNHSCSACTACCHLLALAQPLPTMAPPALLVANFFDLPLPSLGIAPRLSRKPPRL